MKFINILNKRLLAENISCPCKMFWCIPTPVDGSIKWEVVTFDSDGDDLSNWLIVLHKLKRHWGVDFDSCRECHSGLPRGILVDGCLLHGNNIPPSLDLQQVASSLAVTLGDDVTPVYDKDYSVNQKDLSRIEDIIGKDLNIQYVN